MTSRSEYRKIVDKHFQTHEKENEKESVAADSGVDDDGFVSSKG